MSGVHDVDCSGCGRRHSLSADQARKQRVVRCECGQFVRMDRALAELRSDPAPAPVAADRAAHASLSGDGRKSLPAPRPPMPSLSGALWPVPTAAGDKPLWYVDLGGSETVEMTIEQLITARRSGKLGEGALVWRAGMSRWRPVGTLIPAASRPTSTLPPPRLPAPVSSRPPPPVSPAPSSRAPEPTPKALGSYERPVATLDFALEKPLPATTHEARRLPAAPPTPPRRTSELPPPAPKPLPAQALARQVSVLTPVPPPLGQASAPAAPVPPPITSSSVSAPVTLPPSSARPSDARGERPRWVTAALALLLCVAASGSGAFLVRSLRAHRQPLPLSPSGDAVTQAGASSPDQVAPKAPSVSAPAPSSSTRVVDINSLSVEPNAPRAVWRSPQVVTKTPAPAAADDSTPATDSEPPSTAPVASTKPQIDTPPPASPYTTGTLGEAAAQ